MTLESHSIQSLSDHFSKELSQEHLEDGIRCTFTVDDSPFLFLSKSTKESFDSSRFRVLYTFDLDRWCVLLDVRVSGSLDPILK